MVEKPVDNASDKVAGGGVWIGFDLGGTKMLSVAYNGDFEEIGRRRRKTRADLGTDRIVETINMTLDDAGASRKQLKGIGIGCPGPLDLKKGTILEAPNLGWKNTPIRSLIGDEFKCPVVICNDVDAGVFGEYRFGAGKNARCVLGIFPGTGIGGGMVYEGRIFRGSRVTAMEVGYIQMATEGAMAGLGGAGSLEGLASRLAIAAEAAKAVYRGQAPVLKELAGTDISAVRSGTLAKSIEGGDKVIRAIVERAAEQVGRAIGSLVNVLVPDVVILGGGLVEAMPKLFLNAAQTGIKRNILPSLKDEFELRAAELGDDAAVLGAAAWALADTSAKS